METWKKTDGFATVRGKVNGNFAAVDAALAEAGAKLEQAKAALTGQIGRTETALERALETAQDALSGQISAVQELAASKAAIVTGTYAGDSTEEREISLGFSPKLVFFCDKIGRTTENSITYGALVLPGYPAGNSNGGTGVKISENGFKLYSSSNNRVNNTNYTYYYFAVA